jgi:hypothetical protein
VNGFELEQQQGLGSEAAAAEVAAGAAQIVGDRYDYLLK